MRDYRRHNKYTMRTVDRAPLDIEKVGPVLAVATTPLGIISKPLLGCSFYLVDHLQLSPSVAGHMLELQCWAQHHGDCVCTKHCWGVPACCRSWLYLHPSVLRVNVYVVFSCVHLPAPVCLYVHHLQMMSGMPLKPEDVTYSAYETLVRDRGV